MFRALGSVLGAFVGDAAGAVLEFLKLQDIKDIDVENALLMKGGGVMGMGKGQVTDDSEMAMCLVNALTEEDIQTLNLNLIQKYFGMWYQSNPFDIGNTTHAALRVIDINKLDPTISFKNTLECTKTSKSNGCLMRITPLALYCSSMNKDDMYMAITLETMFTHPLKLAIDACYLYCYAIKLLIDGMSRSDTFEEIKKEASLRKFTQLQSWLEDVENQDALNIMP